MSRPVPSTNQESGAQIRDETHDESATLTHCQDDVWSRTRNMTSGVFLPLARPCDLVAQEAVEQVKVLLWKITSQTNHTVCKDT